MLLMFKGLVLKNLSYSAEFSDILGVKFMFSGVFRDVSSVIEDFRYILEQALKRV
jgi:hypothetical protein